jgi:regulator of sirC expression with transglutaminase-like and TPR domain
LSVDPREEFAQSLDAPDAQIDLCRAALWVAAEEYPELDVPDYLARLDALADDLRPRFGDAPIAERVAALNRFLFVEHGFSGNRSDYYDPRNSYLNDVLDRRTGIPITLALVYIGTARRAGLEAAGIGFPGHFLARIEGPQTLIVDPFIGELLSDDECEKRFSAVAPGERLRPEVHLRGARPREVLVRLLSNLKRVFLERRDLERVLACIERILIATPAALHEIRDRGLIYDQLGYDAAAASDLQQFLDLAPEDPSAEPVTQRLAAVRRRMRVH